MVRKASEKPAETAELTIGKLHEITGTTDNVEAVKAYLQRAQTPADLRAAGLAVAPIIASTDGLFSSEEVDSLRELYGTLMALIQHVIEAKTLDGLRVTIARAKYVETKVGPTYRLTGKMYTTTGEVKPFECWMPGSSRGPVYRFFNSRAHTAYPVDVCFRLQPHPTDDDKTMWEVELLPPVREAKRSSAVPF